LTTRSIRLDVFGAVFAAALGLACPGRPVETVTTLSHELPGASFEVERSEVDFGRPEAHPVMTRGWGQDEGGDDGDVDGTFVWSVGDESVLSLFLARTRPLTLSLRARPAPFPSLGPQAIAVAVNGNAIGELELVSADDRYTVSIPEAVLAPGENRIAFRYRWVHSPAEMTAGSTDVRRVAVQWIHLEVTEPETSSASEGSARRHANATAPPSVERDEPAGGIWLPPASRAVFHLEAPSEAWLEVEVLEGDGRLDLTVERQSGGDAVHVNLAPGQQSGRIPLAGREPDVARIALSTSAPDGAPNGRLHLIGRVRHRAPPSTDARDALPSGTAVTEIVRPDPDSRPNIVLYVTDTLRADRLGAYGYDRPITPNLDAFASTAVVFERGLAQAPYTRPSTASILTGLSPATHRVLGMNDVLPSNLETLAKILHAAGYETAGFVANGNVIGDFGFAEGYDHFADLSGPDRTRDRGFEIHARHADGADHEFVAPLNEYVFEWLDRRPVDRPFFLYVHAVEPHSPYNPPPLYRDRFAPGVGETPLDPETEAVVRRLQESFIARGVPQAKRGIGSRAWLHALAAGVIRPTERVLADLNALYDAEVAYADAAFGALMAELERRHLVQDAAIVFVSDHGEEFFEHGSWEHGKTLHSEVLRVPMIARFPGDAPRGTRVSTIARQIDLVPTLLEVVGLPTPGDLDGRSLLPAIGGQVDQHAPSLAFVDLNGFEAQSLEEGEWKLIEALRPTAELSLFARNDPGEIHDLARAEPILAGWLAARLRTEVARARTRVVESATTEIDPEREAQLRAMGYVD
jgi:arylsulfatase A-like enzyme